MVNSRGTVLVEVTQCLIGNPALEQISIMIQFKNYQDIQLPNDKASINGFI